MNQIVIRPILFFILLTSFFEITKAQETSQFDISKITLKDFESNHFDTASRPTALIIANIGSSEFVVDRTKEGFESHFSEYKRLRILNENGLSIAKISVPISIDSKNNGDRFVKLKAATYNLENGEINTFNLDSTSIIYEKISNDLTNVKFTLSNVKIGSVIEYSYEIYSPKKTYLHTWQFESKYPCLLSEYKLSVPEFFEYKYFYTGTYPIDLIKEENRIQKFKVNLYLHLKRPDFEGSYDLITRDNEIELNKNVNIKYWKLQNIPGKKEDTNELNSGKTFSKIEFQLEKENMLLGLKNYELGDWKKTSENLMSNQKFGLQFTIPNPFMHDQIKQILKNTESSIEKVKIIYEFVRDNFNCTNYNSIYASTSSIETFKNKKGNVADINLLLISMLHEENIEANPVILCTRSNGKAPTYYPILDKFNYLIAQIKIGKDIFYLDASYPHLGFTKLPSEIYNGYARLIKKGNTIPINFNNGLLKDVSQTNIIINNDEKNAVVGSFSKRVSDLKSFEIRKELSKIKPEYYVSKLIGQERSDMIIDNLEIDSLSKLDFPILIKFDFVINSFKNKDTVQFNPFVENRITENPCKSELRLDPFYFPFTQDYIYNLTMEIPKGYTVYQLPKPIRIILNNRIRYYKRKGFLDSCKDGEFDESFVVKHH